MGNEEVGECSRNRDDDSERPLKKAKYVWQVKGKYHLKGSQTNREEVPQSHENTENNIPHGSEDSCHHNCIDNMLTRTESILDEMASDDDDTSTRNIDKVMLREIPVTLVSPNPENQNYYLRKWQARQMARSYIDNTINAVLESWASSNAPGTPFDDEDFIDNCDEDGNVEDEGILMAIKSHGLQSNKIDEMSEDGHNSEEFINATFSANIKNNKIQTKLEIKVSSDEGPSVEERTSEPEMEVSYPVDVLNAAIMTAIERKGLSSV